jgi:hypothetical protein
VGDDVVSDGCPAPVEFPLTRLQRAYVAGRHPDYPWGGLAAHDHRVYRGPLDLDRFRAAWRAALARHEMLRMVVDPGQGTQRVLARPPSDGIVVHDLRDQPPRLAAAAAASVGARLGHELRPLDRWPLIGVEVCLLPEVGGVQAHEVHFSLEQTVLDLASWWTVLDEVSADYARPGAAPPRPAVSFSDHEAERADRAAALPAPVPDLPPGPPVPARYDAPARVEVSHSWLAPADWAALRGEFRGRRIGETVLVFAVLAQVIGAWRECTRFTVSAPRSQRVPYHPDVARIVGPLSTFTLLPFDLRGGHPGDPAGGAGSLLDLASATQRRLWTALSTPEEDGMLALEAFTATGRGGRTEVAVPIVLTSLLGVGDPARPVLGGMHEVSVHSQNAQVALDVRIDQPGEALHLAWHERAGVFGAGEVAGVAAVTERVLVGLADGELELDAPGVTLRATVAGLLAEVAELTDLTGMAELDDVTELAEQTEVAGLS